MLVHNFIHLKKKSGLLLLIIIIMNIHFFHSLLLLLWYKNNKNNCIYIKIILIVFIQKWNRNWPCNGHKLWRFFHLNIFGYVVHWQNIFALYRAIWFSPQNLNNGQMTFGERGGEKWRSGITCDRCCEMWVCWRNMALLELRITALSDPLCLFLAAQLPVTSRQPTHKHTRIYTCKQIHTIHAQYIKGMRQTVCTHKHALSYSFKHHLPSMTR